MTILAARAERKPHTLDSAVPAIYSTIDRIVLDRSQRSERFAAFGVLLGFATMSWAHLRYLSLGALLLAALYGFLCVALDHHYRMKRAQAQRVAGFTMVFTEAQVISVQPDGPDTVAVRFGFDEQHTMLLDSEGMPLPVAQSEMYAPTPALVINRVLERVVPIDCLGHPLTGTVTISGTTQVTVDSLLRLAIDTNLTSFSTCDVDIPVLQVRWGKQASPSL